MGMLLHCVIHICSAHLMHKISSKVKHYEKDLWKFLLQFTARFVEAKSLNQLSDFFRKLCQICLAKDNPSQDLMKEAEEILKTKPPAHIEEDENPDLTQELSEEPGPSWVASTPYYRHFQDIRNSIIEELDDGLVSKPYHAPEFVSYFLGRFLAIVTEHFWDTIPTILLRIGLES